MAKKLKQIKKKKDQRTVIDPRLFSCSLQSSLLCDCVLRIADSLFFRLFKSAYELWNCGTCMGFVSKYAISLLQDLRRNLSFTPNSPALDNSRSRLVEAEG